MMDHGQHHQHQGSRNDNDDNIAGGPYNFTSNPQQEDYNSYFTNDGNSSFNSPWDPTSIIDPRIQPNGFTQTPQEWHQNSLNTTTSHQPPNYGLQSSNYANAFARPHDAYATYPGFHPQHQHPFPTSAYDPALTFGNPNLLNGTGFDVHGSQGYGQPPAPSQTISPSALQSFNPYSQFPAPSDDQSLHLGNSSQLAFNAAFADLPLYDERLAESLAALDPNAPSQESFTSGDFTMSSNNIAPPNFTGFVFLGDTYASDEPRVIPPKVTRRKSVKQMRQQVQAVHGNKPFYVEDKPLAKRLKLIHKGSRSIVNGSSGQVAQSDSSSSSESESGSEEESEYSSESDDQTGTDEPSPLPAARPTDPRKAIEYDIIKCVWSKRTARVTADAIRTALGEYWEIIKRIRDNWKADATALQQIDEAKDKARADQYKSRAAEQRRIIESAFRLTVQHGHRDIVEKLGDIPGLLFTFSQLITDRLKDGDVNGSLVESMVQFMIRCTSIDRELWEKTKLDKLLAKVVKRSEGSIKAHAQKVLDNVEQYSKQKSAIGKAAQTVEPTRASGPIATGTQRRTSEPVPVAKRQRDVSTATAAPKKADAKSSSTVLSKTAGSLVKGDPKASGSALTANVTQPKVKVNHVIPKASVFSSLQSASKKPGTSIAAQKLAQQNDTKISKPSDGKAAGPSAPAAAPKPAFSFAETMANLTKPKEAPSATKSIDSGPPETEEEKKKRLRKEERRKLRVSFKPEDSLVEVRTFVHDPEEELGHDDSMIRDVGDVGGEGRMLKMHKELEIMDEDDDSNAGEEELAPWKPPSLVDFSVVDVDELARNCTTRGGKVEVKSRERAVQEQRELTTLMVFYTYLSDVPPSPREPADPYTGDASVELEFGRPSDETKIREAQFYAAQNPQSHSLNESAAGGVAIPDINSLLQILNTQQQAVQSQQTYQATQAPSNGLEAIFAQFSGNMPPAPPPAPAQPTAFIDPSIAAALAAINQQHIQGQTPYVAAPPVQSQTPDLQALLSRLGQQQSVTTQNYGYQGGYQNENDRKRQYDYDDQRQNDQYSDGKRVRGNNGKKFFGIPRVPCKFWHEGKCKKGDDCTFLHD